MNPPIKAAKNNATNKTFDFAEVKVRRTSLRRSKTNTPATGIMAEVVKYVVETNGTFMAMNSPSPKVKLYDNKSR